MKNMLTAIRTDLAAEARDVWRESAEDTTKLSGVEAYDEVKGNYKIVTVKILDENGSRELRKPVGTYITVELDSLIRREENAFSDAVRLVASELCEMLQLTPEDRVLVAGLGNAAITPDAIGPETINSVMVTRHLKERYPGDFVDFRDVAAVRSGVLGTTGIESAEMISAIASHIKPTKIIAVDALASRSMSRLCRTLQIADTGIIPGSGVGNARVALNAETLGVPVIAIGVPTVVDAATLAVDIARKAGVSNLNFENIGDTGTMIVTPRDIDSSVRDTAKLIGYSINLALHEGLTMEDVDMFLS